MTASSHLLTHASRSAASGMSIYKRSSTENEGSRSCVKLPGCTDRIIEQLRTKTSPQAGVTADIPAMQMCSNTCQDFCDLEVI